jgi:hypothetical protein
MFRPIWPSSGVKTFVIGETAALVVVAVMHTYPPKMRTHVVVTVPCLLQPIQLRVLS